MSDVNSCVIMGKLTGDAERKEVGKAATVLINFTIENCTGSGAYAHTNYFPVNLWGKTGEQVFPMLKKGTYVIVNGMLENRQWQNSMGQMVDSWQMTAMAVSVLPIPVEEQKEEKPPVPDLPPDFTF